MKIINILLSSLLIRGTESFMIPAPDSASKLLIPPLQMTWTHLADIDSFSREMQQQEQQLQQQEQINSYSTTKSEHLNAYSPPPSEVNKGSSSPRRITLRRYLNSLVKENPELRDLESLSLSIQMACKTISNLVSRNGINSLSMPPPSSNTNDDVAQSGQQQYDVRMNSMKRLDELSTIVLRNALKFTGKLQSVKKAKDQRVGKDESEHQPGVVIAIPFDSKYIAYFDPLDGSGNADAAICTGTVFGIFKTPEDESSSDDEGIDNVVLGGGDGVEGDGGVKVDRVVDSVLQPGKNLVAAGYCLYSSSTILIFTMGDGTHGFTLDPQVNEFVLTHPNIKIPPRGNVYSCNEAKSEGWDEDMHRYLHALKSGENETGERYALRYVGSMVGDIHRTLMYGGIFFYPGSTLQPNGHLQLVYKSAPLSYVIEQAGGMSTDGKGSLLERQPQRVHERSPCFIGSPEDIKEMKKYIKHLD
jgi:fructose-1,6-bisphosphatase I